MAHYPSINHPPTCRAEKIGASVTSKARHARREGKGRGGEGRGDMAVMMVTMIQGTAGARRGAAGILVTSDQIRQR